MGKFSQPQVQNVGLVGKAAGFCPDFRAIHMGRAGFMLLVA